jgi:hypothetical protein
MGEVANHEDKFSKPIRICIRRWLDRLTFLATSLVKIQEHPKSSGGGVDNGKLDIYFIRPGWQMIASTAHLNFGLAKPEVLNDGGVFGSRVNHPSLGLSLACPAAFLKSNINSARWSAQPLGWACRPKAA